MFERIRNILGSIFGIFLTRAESAVPLEERLKYDRQRKAGTLKQQMDRAANIGALANEAVVELAETRSEVEGLREDAKEHVRLAQLAESRGDSAEEERQMSLAAQKSDELAEAQAELARLEADVNDALSNKEAAKKMVFDQAEQLQKLARNDSRLVRQVQMTQMREQSLALTEEMAQIIPEDRDTEVRVAVVSPASGLSGTAWVAASLDATASAPPASVNAAGSAGATGASGANVESPLASGTAAAGASGAAAASGMGASGAAGVAATASVEVCSEVSTSAMPQDVQNRWLGRCTAVPHDGQNISTSDPRGRSS